MNRNCLSGNVLLFSAESGNRYIYNNKSGLTFLEVTSVLNKLTGGYLGIDHTSAPLPGKINEQTVKAYIAEYSFNQLMLEMTADCNFRCKYCIYGEHYTAACVPEDKIYVTVDGKYHICEHVPHDMHIGGVDNVLDFRAITELLELLMKMYADTAQTAPFPGCAGYAFPACGRRTRSSP